MIATNILRAEHEVILDVLNALESIARNARGGALDLVSAREAVDFLRTFADRCHHTKEEQHFFPALASRGLPLHVGPLAVMLSDHEAGRALIARMALALEPTKRPQSSVAGEFAAAANEYVTLMRDHIAKENGVLFPMGDGMLTAKDQESLAAAFEHVEHHDLAPDAHACFLDLARRLCERHGIRPGTGATVDSGHSCGRHACHG